MTGGVSEASVPLFDSEGGCLLGCEQPARSGWRQNKPCLGQKWPAEANQLPLQCTAQPEQWLLQRLLSRVILLQRTVASACPRLL